MANFKARYIPKHPGKYLGNVSKILARSSWEINVMKFFDQSSSVLQWSSEPFPISYISPLDLRPHKYWPDFFVAFIDGTGNVVKEIVEVKPLKESVEAAAKSVYDKKALAVNQAKWQAATAFANAHGMGFRVITELSIFKQIPKVPKKAKAKAVKAAPKPKAVKKAIPAKTTIKSRGTK
jgi:hypothetical protein